MKEHALEWTTSEASLPQARAQERWSERGTERRAGWRASDAFLVQLARRGGRLAFDALWVRHAPAVHAVLVSLLPPHEAEDLLQETAVSAWSKIRTLEKAGRFSAWVCAIARHKARDRARALAERRALRLEDVSEPAQGPTSHPSGWCAEADEVLARLRELPPCYAEPLLMKLMLGMDNAEIAERTGMTRGSVRVNLHRGLRRLRHALGPDFAP